MVTIPTLPLAQQPLTGGELVPIWQNGQLVQVNQAAFAIPSALQAEITTVANNITQINTVASNINAILAANFTAANTSFDPTGLTYFNATNLQTLGSQIDTEFSTFLTNQTNTLLNYALKANDLTQFINTTATNFRGKITGTTGTGNLVFATGPALTAPTLGVATATSINKLTFTQPATGATITVADGTTLTTTANTTLSGTNTGDQTITLSGAAVGTGTGSFSVTQVIQGSMYIGTGSNQTIVPISYTEYPLTINQINNLQTTSGTITLDVQINGTPVTGLHNLSVTNTPQSPNATALNTMNVGDQLTFVFSSNAAAVGIQFTMKATRS